MFLLKRNFLFFLLLFPFFYKGQNAAVIDSFFTRYRTAPTDSEKTYALVEIAEIYMRTGSYDSALKYSDWAFSFANEKKFKRGQGVALNLQGIAYWYTDNYPEALRAQMNAMKVWKDIQSGRGVSICYGNMGLVYMDQGNYPKALENYLAALKLQEKMKKPYEVGVSCINIGNLYNNMENYKMSKQYHFRALEIFKKLDDKQSMAACLSNVGNIFLTEKNYSEALKYQAEAVEISKEIDDKEGLAATLNAIGTVYIAQGEWAKALSEFSEALSIQASIKDKSGIANSYFFMSGVYYRTGKLKEAEEHCKKSLAIHKEINSLEGKANCYERLSDIYLKGGKFQQSLEAYKSYITYRDSLLNEENTKKNVRLEMNFEFEAKEAKAKSEQEKKDALAAQQNRVKELQLSRSRYFTYGLSGLILLMIVIGILFFRQNKIRSEQRAMQLEQKLLRTQMNPHFIFNSLNSIHSVVLSGETKTAAKYLASFAKLIRAILESSRFEMIPLEKEIALLENYIHLQMLRFENQVHYEIKIDPQLDIHNTLLPPMLTQPFIENALEHGLYNIKENPELLISFAIFEGMLQVEVKDNGPGISETPGNSQHISMATTITSDRLKLLNRNKRKKTVFSIGDAFPGNAGRKGVKVSFLIPLDLV